jgi:Tc toxin complex TcA C-terminal TcB-binding domain/Neuraminidase-like domain
LNTGYSFLLRSFAVDILEMAHTAGTTEAALLQTLTQRTGWNQGDLAFLVGSSWFGFSSSFPASYRDERALARLMACFAVSLRLGVSAVELSTWVAPDLTATQARSIKQAVKARYDADQWLAVVKPLSDILREKKRVALVDYLVTRRRFRSPSSLYAHYLIDVEMSACQTTTRILQAISALQLFVQRCLMRLEAGVALTSADASEWAWMKNYRVWEANRKLFLYPENWIEPELRDNKTPFFQELEQELLQKDLIDEAAREAYLHYLEKLDAVARLEICGAYHLKEVEQGRVVIDTLHVFGRTWGTPHLYYYRQYSGGEWKPWQKVDLDVEGDHLIPVVYNRRLFLFWAIFTEKVGPTITLPDAGQNGTAPPKYWEIKLAWSEYKGSYWSAKKTSVDALAYVPAPNAPLPPKSEFTFKAFTDGPLAMGCYTMQTTTTTSALAAEAAPLALATTSPASLVESPADVGNGAIAVAPLTTIAVLTAPAPAPEQVLSVRAGLDLDPALLAVEAGFAVEDTPAMWSGTFLVQSEVDGAATESVMRLPGAGGPVLPEDDLTASLTSDPANGPRGTTFRLDGIDFGLRDRVTLTVRLPDGTTLTSSLTTDTAGEFTTNLVTTDGVSQVGIYRITATGGTTGSTASRSINVYSSRLEVTASPSPALREQTIRLTGAGFSPAEAVTFRVAPPAGAASNIGSAPAGTDGVARLDYATTQFHPIGSYGVTATGSSSSVPSHVATGSFTVTAPNSLSVNPTDGPRGTTFMLEVSGYGPSEQVTMYVTPPGQSEMGIGGTTTELSGTARKPYLTNATTAPTGWYLARAVGSRVTEVRFEVKAAPVPTSAIKPIGEFLLATSYGDPKAYGSGAHPDEVALPTATKIENMQVVKDPTDAAVQLRLDQSPNLKAGVAVLNRTPGQFRLLAPHQNNSAVGRLPFFYQDATRTFFVDGYYRFRPFYHPYMDSFIREVYWGGIERLLQRAVQMAGHDYFEAEYSPVQTLVRPPYPREEVDFSDDGAYAPYNWELFFHIPLLIADRLSKNQRFDEAQRWFHFMFDPMDGSSHPAPQRYWRTRPFYEAAAAGRTIRELQTLLSSDVTNAERLRRQLELARQVLRWRRNPFNAHLVARMRAAAYPKAVVMKYIDNLIAWADQLFRRNTVEAINEATQLYILAADILGPRPQRVTPRTSTPAATFNELRAKADVLLNAAIELEQALPPSSAVALAAPAPETPPSAMQMLSLSRYFMLPKNEWLLAYWDTVADRLFKIRHCMSIEGTVQQLPLFEPPIDPTLLARAVALGLDVGAAVNGLTVAMPQYRFTVMLQKANELCADLKALGGALLAALEKRDGEALALLRSSHEIQVVKAARQVKVQQIAEAKQSLEGLRKSRDVVQARYDYYSTREFENERERTHVDKLTQAHILQLIGQGYELASSVAFSIPEFDVGISGAGGSPVAKARYGGSNVGHALQAYSRGLNMLAARETYEANMAQIMGGYDRRLEDWKHQATLADKELKQIDTQILAAEIRQAIAEQDLRNHDLQAANALAVDAYMRDKFTNEDLYHWMIGQVSAVYFQTYQLAYDIAKRAEKAFQFELGVSNTNFFQDGHWDCLKKGLLAGELLQYDLRRLEMAYLDQNRRDYEITKHVSLAQLDPVSLLILKESGACTVELPEELFDLDYPGHYLRRLKSVSLTIPCVTGPFTSVNCTLTMIQSRVRRNPSLAGGYAEVKPQDERFAYDRAAVQSIVTSSAQNDSGLFETNLRDERYLFFEGTGAISTWRIELPQDCNQFDFRTISDVIFHLKYTAKDGGEPLRQAARAAVVQAMPRTGVRLFSARHEFPTEWYRFLHPTDQPGQQQLTLDLSADRFPFQFRNRPIKIGKVELVLQLSDSSTWSGTTFKLGLTPTNPTAAEQNEELILQKNPALGNLLHTDKNYVNGKNLGTWTLRADADAMAPMASAIEDLGILCHYSVAAPS